MTLRTKNIGPILILALAVATLVVVVGMWGWDGPPPVSAQTDTTAPTVLKVSVPQVQVEQMGSTRLMR